MGRGGGGVIGKTGAGGEGAKTSCGSTRGDGIGRRGGKANPSGLTNIFDTMPRSHAAH